MDDEEQRILGNNRIEDVRWLCSLTDSELDLLVGLKSLVMQRARKIGHAGLAKKFDLKMLRGLSVFFPLYIYIMDSLHQISPYFVEIVGFVLMENLKGQVKELATTPSSVEYSEFLRRCNWLKCNPDDSFASLGVEELRRFVCNNKMRIFDLFNEDMIPSKKQKTEPGDSAIHD